MLKRRAIGLQKTGAASLRNQGGSKSDPVAVVRSESMQHFEHCPLRYKLVVWRGSRVLQQRALIASINRNAGIVVEGAVFELYSGQTDKQMSTDPSIIPMPTGRGRHA